MLIFRIFLLGVSLWVNVTAWIAIYYHGPNLFSVVGRDLSSNTWNAQFDADLLCYLAISGLWIAWRHNFKPWVIPFGAVGGFLGNAFMAPYILFLTYQTKGDMRKLIMGERA